MIKSRMMMLTGREKTDVIDADMSVGYLLLERWWVSVR
jgi:hypothetical protein